MKPEHDPTSIGNLARIFHGVTDEELQGALALTERRNQPLGSCLVAMGTMTPDQLAGLLEKQKCLRGKHPGRADVNRVMDFVTDRCQSWVTPLREQFP